MGRTIRYFRICRQWVLLIGLLFGHPILACEDSSQCGEGECCVEIDGDRVCEHKGVAQDEGLQCISSKPASSGCHLTGLLEGPLCTLLRNGVPIQNYINGGPCPVVPARSVGMIYQLICHWSTQCSCPASASKPGQPVRPPSPNDYTRK